MALRLIEMLIPEDARGEAEESLEGNEFVLDFWCDWVSGGQVSISIIVTAKKSQTVLDELDNKFSKYGEFRLIVSPIEAMIPRPQEPEEKPEEKAETPGISREELYEQVLDESNLTMAYVSLILIASIVAAVGVLRNDIIVIIGAMVIAPMIGPSMGLSLATTLAEPVLGKKALKTSLIGILLAFTVSALIGIILTIDTSIPFIVSRTHAGLVDIGLALAAGSAGAIAFTRKVSTAIVGVMVSIALLPTLVVSGLLFGSGSIINSGEALLLFLIYLTCVNLAGVITFLIERIKPKSWWTAKKAKKMTKIAVTIWIMLLIILVLIIVYMNWGHIIPI